MELSTILALLAIIIAIAYYFLKKEDVYKAHGIPSVPTVPIFGNMGPIVCRQMPMTELANKMYKAHPEAKYVLIYDFTFPILLIRDPELIKTIAVKNFEHFPDHRSFINRKSESIFSRNLFLLRGEEWRSVRNLLSPAFTSSKMKIMFKLISNCAADFSDFLSNIPEEKREMEMKDAFTRYTNDVIATCAFGIGVNSMRDPENAFYMHGRKVTSFVGSSRLKSLFIRCFPNLSTWLNLQLIDKNSGQFFKDIIESTIQRRDEKGIYRPDMVQLMMETRSKKGDGKELTIDDMTAQAFIFFIAGFETISTLLCFTAHTLAVEPEIQKKLQDEIDKALINNKGEFTYESIAGMEYLDAVISECLRMYPVVLTLDRICDKSYELPPAVPGAKPFTVKKGMGVWFPVYGMQHDPKYYDKPEIFRPERFLENGKKILSSGTYFPFGTGPRMCIGNRFALMEAKLLLCHFLARCELKRAAKTTVPIKLSKQSLTMRAADGFWVKVQPRKNPPSIVTSVEK